MDTGLSRRFMRWAMLSSLTGTAVVVASYISRIPVGSRDGRWAYPFIGPFHLKLLLPFLIAGLLASTMLWLSTRISERHEHATVLGWLVGGLLAQLILRWYAASAATLGAVVSSDLANSFYGPTLHYGAFEFLSRFPDIRSSLPLHAVTNMPGKVMFFYLIELFTAKPEVMGIIIMALSNLGGWLLYLAVRDLFHDKRTALYALILYLFVPCKLYFMPLLNTVAPVLILLCFYCFVRFLMSQRWPWALGLGVGLYLTTFFDPLPLVMGIFFGIFLAASVFDGRTTAKSISVLLCVSAATFVTTYATMRVAFHYDLFESFAYAMRNLNNFNVRSGRSYGIWWYQNLLDFGRTIGAATVVLTPLSVVAAMGRYDCWEKWLQSPIILWISGAIAVLAFLTIVGVNRGEVVRLWIFLACFFVVIPAYFCAQARSIVPIAIVLGSTLLEDAVGIGIIDVTIFCLPDVKCGP